jgi:hypothetical protein
MKPLGLDMVRRKAPMQLVFKHSWLIRSDRMEQLNPRVLPPEPSDSSFEFPSSPNLDRPVWTLGEIDISCVFSLVYPRIVSTDLNSLICKI